MVIVDFWYLLHFFYALVNQLVLSATELAYRFPEKKLQGLLVVFHALPHQIPRSVLIR